MRLGTKRRKSPNVEAFPYYRFDEAAGRQTDELAGYHVFTTIPLSNHTFVRAITSDPAGLPANPKDAVWFVGTEVEFAPGSWCRHQWMNLDERRYLAQLQALQVGTSVAERVGLLDLASCRSSDDLLGMFMELQRELEQEGLLSSPSGSDESCGDAGKEER